MKQPAAITQPAPQTPDVAVGVTPLVPLSPQVYVESTPMQLTLPSVTPLPTAPPTLIPVAENTALSLLILHTSDTRGYVDPCG